MPSRHALILPAAAALLTACGTAPPVTPPATTTAAPPASAPARPAQQPPPQASTKYYKDDGPGDNPPRQSRRDPRRRPAARAAASLRQPAVHVLRTRLRAGDRPQAYRERGIASWYGRKFHGEKTSTGETYDMYAMTAAHPTLPLPSYARVTNVATGKSVVVRVNDRGPFLHGRVIDLSFAAAQRIGIAQKGSGEVEVEAILPDPGGAAVPAATARRRCRPCGRIRHADDAPPPIPIASAGTAVSSCSSGRLQILPMRRTFVAHLRTKSSHRRVEPSVPPGQAAVPRVRRPVSGARRREAHGGPPARRTGVRPHDQSRPLSASCGGQRSRSRLDEPARKESEPQGSDATLSATPVRYNSMLPSSDGPYFGQQVIESAPP